MKLIDRPLYISKLMGLMNTPEIKVITGVRRSGKSKLLAAFADYVQKVDPKANIIEIDFTKLRFEPLREYHALNDYAEAHHRAGVSNYLMIDEVQLCLNFEIAINSLHSEEKYDIYITGSNAFLLSSDLATLFTGRHIDIHVYPFSFKEYCAYFDGDEPLQEKFDKYVMRGGFAGSYSYANDSDKTKYVHEVYETVLIRDLVDRYRLNSSSVLKRVANFLMDNVGNISSSRNISNAMPALGDAVSHSTVVNYISYLCNAFVFYEAKRYDVKGKSYLQSLSKYYLVDAGMRVAELGKRNLDWGRLYENIVFLELLRRGYDVYVGKLYQKEIDFVAMRGDEKIYIQVADDISGRETLAREVAPLLQVKDAYPKFILARTRHEETDYEGVRIVDIASWLMQ